MSDYFFLLSSVAWYVLPAWIVPLTALAGQTGNWYLADLWVVRPQVRLLLLACPPLRVHWPGPVSGPLETGHRLLFSLFYALLGWIGVRLVTGQYSFWSARLWWLGVYWATAFLFMQTVVFLMMHFGALPRG